MDELVKAGDDVSTAIAAYAGFYPDVRHPSYRHLLDAIERFKDALEAARKHANLPPPDPGRVEQALTIQENPVFIGGAGKSGTTLLRNLLDGHPQLTVFYPEGPLMALLHRYAHAAYEERREVVLSRNLDKLITHNVGRGPNWLLSGGRGDVQPYLSFVTLYRQRLEKLPRTDAGLIRAVIYAYLLAQEIPAEQLRDVTWWVEKTPLNVYFVERLLTMFPKAKFIFCVRDPRGITASAKFRYLKKYGGFDFQWTVEEIRKRWKLMVEATDRHGPDVCLTVRYEDIVQDTARVMERMAGFLGIRFDEAMLSPTMADLPASQNTAFEQRLSRATVSSASIDRWKTALTQAEIAYVSAYVHPYTRRFGYDVGSTALPGYLRAASRLRRDYRAEGLNFSLRRAISAWVSR
jgi:hypothetical protein